MNEEHQMGDVARNLQEIELIAEQMENLGPGSMEEASRLLARAAFLHRQLEQPLLALERLTQGCRVP